MLKNKLSLNTAIFILVIIAGIEVVGLFCHHSTSPQPNNQKEIQQKNDTAGPAIFMPLINNTANGLYCIVDWLDTNSDAVVALATIAIALFTFTLWQTSKEHSRHMEASIAVARDTASATKGSAEVLRAIERARIFVNVEHIESGEMKVIESMQEGPNRIRVNIINEGRSLATITKFNWYVVAIESGEIESKIAELKSLESSMIPVIKIRGNDTVERIIRFEINTSDVQRVETSSAHFYCLGYIRYKDVFRNVRPITFCWKDEGIFFSRDPEHSTDG